MAFLAGLNSQPLQIRSSATMGISVGVCRCHQTTEFKRSMKSRRHVVGMLKE